MNSIDTSRDILKNVFRSWLHLTAVIISSALLYAFIRTIGFTENQGFAIAAITVLLGILVPFVLSENDFADLMTLMTGRRLLVAFALLLLVILINTSTGSIEVLEELSRFLEAVGNTTKLLTKNIEPNFLGVVTCLLVPLALLGAWSLTMLISLMKLVSKK